MAKGNWQPDNVVSRHESGRWRFLFTLFSVMSLVGCQERDRKDTLAQLQQCLDKQQALQQQLQEYQARNTELEREMVNLRQFPANRMDYLVRVERIELGRFTGGYDDDKDGRDDRLKVYLVLYDQENDVVKAAGEVDLEIWDLALADKPCLYRKHVSLEELGQYWLGGFLADHYKFDIPFSDQFAPAHNDLTIKVNFTDALTGKTHSFQQLITVVR